MRFLLIHFLDENAELELSGVDPSSFPGGGEHR